MKINRHYHVTEFNKLWLTFIVSSIANWLYKFALPLIILAKTGSAYHAASVFGVSFIPWLCFSLIGGSLADAWHKKWLLFVGNCFSAVFTTLLILVLSSKSIAFGFVYVVVFCLASVDPLTHASFQGIIPDLTRMSELVKANAKLQTVENSLSVLGPLVGGAVVTVLTAQVSLWLNVVAFMISGALMLWVHVEQVTLTKLNLTQLWQSIVEGSRYAFGEKIIFSGSVMFLFTNFALNMFEANLMFYMTHTLSLSTVMVGVVMTVAGVGSLMAGLVADKIIPRFPAGKLLATSTILAGVFTASLFFSTNAWFVGVILGSVSFFGTINVIAYFSLRQRTVPKALLGRVVAVTRMISYASIPVGAWFGGYLIAHGWSMAGIILLAGALRLLSGIGAWLSPLGREH